ncbi:MAG TPA: class I SAM-dependent methyltransferase [Pyrinomonadaceae bacterium]|nr:class I SAM-dependent methyltransferase [Pyrinomonadaceae bacterium]
MSKPALSYQKLRGGYYTPKPIADFLARWAIQSSKTEVLEPSCGDGVLLQSAFEALIAKGTKPEQAAEFLHGVEIDEHEVQRAVSRLEALGAKPSMFMIHTGDFFAYCKAHLKDKRLFDAVIGNPPFIRYQNFIEEQRVPAFELMSTAGMKPNRLTNTWVPFIVASSFLLNEKGRLAMVIPAELLQVNYAADLRRFLSGYYNKITLITFKKLVFEGIQQEVVLLLGERNGDGQTGVRTIELESMCDLASYEHTDFVSGELKPMDHSTEKWTQYFLSKEEIKLLRAIRANPNLTEAGKVIDVDVGIVTGQNQFFVLNDEQIRERGLEAYTLPIVSRSGHLKGAIFSKTDWETNVESDLPTYLLNLPNVPFEELPEAAREYVVSGEKAELHTGYKCRIRNRWYIVPSIWMPDAFMLRQVHGYPKIIVNKANTTCTDTIHRVKLRNGTKADVIAAAFLNSLTFAFSEVIGRSYGGGVLELEPNEAEKLPLPLNGAETLDLKQIHKLLLNDDISAVLDMADKVLLVDRLGLSLKETAMLRRIWQKLRDRRINRKHSGKSNGFSAS